MTAGTNCPQSWMCAQTSYDPIPTYDDHSAYYAGAGGYDSDLAWLWLILTTLGLMAIVMTICCCMKKRRDREKQNRAPVMVKRKKPHK